MKKFEELLLDTIKNDIDYLFQEVYLPNIRNSKRYLTDEYFASLFEQTVNKDEYSLKDVTIMSGIFVSESYMIELIKNFCNDGVLFSVYDDVSRISLIPMFKYFIDKDINNARLISAFFLPIHCSGQMMNVFLNDKVSTKPIFKVNYTLISEIEHYLDSKDLRFDLGSAIYYLNFINYEKKNAFTHSDSEYSNRLNDISLKLENFLSFYGSDDLLTKYSSFRNGLASGREDYSDTELGLSLNNLNFIKHFYDGVLPNYSNKLYVLRNIEENLVNSGNKKDALLASFCYRNYCDDDFFRAFDDIELNVDDVFNFISECEEANLKITNRQVGNLFASFKNVELQLM